MCKMIDDIKELCGVKKRVHMVPYAKRKRRCWLDELERHGGSLRHSFSSAR